MKRTVWIFNYLAVYIVLLLAIISIPKSVYGWGSEREYSAHYFIINKAIKYLKDKNILVGNWPFEEYARTINEGARWADFPIANSVQSGGSSTMLICDWAGFYSGTCDALHHYRKGGDIYCPDASINIGHGGGLGAPSYAQNLYELAIKFWFGGEPIPDIHDLQLKNSGGSITTLFDGSELGPFVIGGFPFAFDMACVAVNDNCPPDEWCFCHKETAYKWPGFLGAMWDQQQGIITDIIPKENIQSSLFYLGWTIHLVEDLSTPVHAENITCSIHKEFEDRADELIRNGSMEKLNLPIDPNNGRTYTSPYISVRPDYFHNDWTIEQYANESANLAIAAKLVPDSDILEIPQDHQIEIDLDTSIKMVAGILYKFFSNFELPKDTFEPNNSPQNAAPISTGRYDYLTIDYPFDEDFYEINVTENYSEVSILLNYDRSAGAELSAYWEYEISQGENSFWLQEWPRNTERGMIFEATYVPVGRKYRIHIYPMQYLAVNYSMEIYVGSGELPFDPYENNNSIDTATPLLGRISNANLHNNYDVDYYKLSANGYSVVAEIIFNPTVRSINLFLDNIQATQADVSDDGILKSIKINGCGNSNSYAKVQGQKGFYSISLSKIPLQEGCPGYNPLIFLKGNGTFVFTGPQYGPGLPPQDQTANLRQEMQAHKTSETATKVIWSIGGFLDLPNGNYLPLILEANCSKQSGLWPVDIDAKILAQDLTSIVWSGKNQGICSGVETQGTITAINTEVNLVSICGIGCNEPGHGILILNVTNENPIADAGGPYNGEINTLITFNAGNSYVINGTIILYEWDWNNDGIYDESIDVPEIKHKWSSTYNGIIKLRITDNKSLTDIDYAFVNTTSQFDISSPINLQIIQSQ